MRQCTAMREDGARCEITFGLCEECGECFHHCDHRAEERTEARRRGGKATARKLQAPGLDADELPPLTDHASAKAWLEVVGRAVATGRLSNRDGNVVVRAVSEWVKAHGEELTAEVVEDLKRRVEELQEELDGREPWR